MVHLYSAAFACTPP